MDWGEEDFLAILKTTIAKQLFNDVEINKAFHT